MHLSFIWQERVAAAVGRAGVRLLLVRGTVSEIAARHLRTCVDRGSNTGHSQPALPAPNPQSLDSVVPIRLRNRARVRPAARVSLKEGAQ